MGLLGLRELWQEWGLRLMVLLSLLIQISLTMIMISQRLRFRSHVLKFLLWLCYSSADAVVIFSLGMISFKLGVANGKSGSLTEQYKLIAFWAPILALFLGGPDSITAYSLEDNELWKRQLLGVIAQVVGAVSILLMAWAHSFLTYLSIVVLVIACVKCGEKTWVLWKASVENLKKSMHSPNPGPDYPKFIEDYCLKVEEGYHLGLHEISEVHELMDRSVEREGTSQRNDHADTSQSDINDDHNDISRAHVLFPHFRRLFVDFILSDNDRITSTNLFTSIASADKAFRVVEIELHFMVDQLHTKAILLYSLWGILVRPAIVLLTLIVTGSFTFFAVRRWENYSQVDLIVTLVLLASICVQELYSLWRILNSYTANDWRHRGGNPPIMCRSRQLRRPNYMGQFCLLDFTVASRTFKTRHLLLEMMNLEKALYTKYVDILPGLKDFILRSIKKLQKEQADNGLEIGEWRKETAVDILRKTNIPESDHKLSWSMQLEFDHCVLVWHIATELWYQKAENNRLTDHNMEWSRLLSRYMVYLLVNQPTLLPDGISYIRIQDTEAEASGFFGGMKSLKCAYEKFYKVSTAVEPLKVKGSISKSVLFDGRRLESGLNVVESDPELRKRKWAMLADVWFHLLVCAAKQCRGSTHAKHLRRGGELLTQVWMLMAHFGLTDHFQLKQGSVISMLRKS